MAQSKILDRHGNPIELGVLEETIGGAQLTGVRQIWAETNASGMTPAKLAGVLIAAQQGDHNEFLTLAEDMEERDPHYGAVLGTRKRAVSGLDATIEAASDEKKDQQIAEFCREYLLTECFDDLLEDSLDALGKSYSVLEIKWERSSIWVPKAFEWQDPHWFVWDRQTRRQLRILTDANAVDGEPLAPYKFVTHAPRVKSGLPIRNGLARMAAFAWICKQYAMKDWMAFIEVFGMPLRVGRYGPNASKDDVSILRRAVASLGTDAAAVLPESMRIDFQQLNAGTAGDQVFVRACDFFDKQVSKGVLGQTSTTDAQPAGLGSNQASVHNEVRDDIKRSDAKRLAATLNRDVLRPLVDLNFGPQEVYPKLHLPVSEPEDTKLLVESVKTLVPLGLKVGMSTMRDKLGLPDPAEGEELLAPPIADTPVPGPENGQIARNSAQSSRPDAPAVQADRARVEGDAPTSAMIDKVKQLLDQVLQKGGSLADFRDQLLDLHSGMDADQLAEVIARGMAASELAGRFDILQGV